MGIKNLFKKKPDYILTKGHFPEATKLSWEDVILKLCDDHKNKTMKSTQSKISLPTYILHNDYKPGTLETIYQSIKKYSSPDFINGNNITTMFLCVSFSEYGHTFGRHNDVDDVLIVQAYGIVSYKFDNGEEVTLYPGDSVMIKKGVYHDPVVNCGPRVTLSCSGPS